MPVPFASASAVPSDLSNLAAIIARVAPIWAGVGTGSSDMLRSLGSAPSTVISAASYARAAFSLVVWVPRDTGLDVPPLTGMMVIRAFHFAPALATPRNPEGPRRVRFRTPAGLSNLAAIIARVAPISAGVGTGSSGMLRSFGSIPSTVISAASYARAAFSLVVWVPRDTGLDVPPLAGFIRI